MAVTEHVAPTTRALHVPRPGRGARRFVIGALLGVVIVLAALIAFRQSYAQRILPGIQVGDVAVGGLTAAEARNALVAALGHVETGDVTVRSGVGNMVVSYSDLGRTVDYDAMVAHAATRRARGHALRRDRDGAPAAGGAGVDARDPDVRPRAAHRCAGCLQRPGRASGAGRRRRGGGDRLCDQPSRQRRPGRHGRARRRRSRPRCSTPPPRRRSRFPRRRPGWPRRRARRTPSGPVVWPTGSPPTSC